MSGHVELRESPIQGKGVFATRRFEVGELILEIDDSRVVDNEHPLDAKIGEFEHHCDWLGDRQVLMREPERYINHSCEPTARIATVDGVRQVIAYRPIEPDAEITYDYLIDAYGGDVWMCSCGEATCRGQHVHDFFELPEHKLHEYLPLLNPWFIEWRRSEIARLREGSGMTS